MEVLIRDVHTGIELGVSTVAVRHIDLEVVLVACVCLSKLHT